MQTAHFRAVPAPYEMMRYHYIMLKHDDVRVRIARIKASQDGTVAFNRVWQDLVGIPTARLLKIVHCQNTWMGVSDGIKWTRGQYNALKKWIGSHTYPLFRQFHVEYLTFALYIIHLQPVLYILIHVRYYYIHNICL